MNALVRLLVPYEVVECPVCENPVDVVPEVLPWMETTWFVPRPEGEVERQCAVQHRSAHPVRV